MRADESISAVPAEKREAKLIGECIYHIHHTMNPRIYFTKYALLLKLLENQHRRAALGKAEAARDRITGAFLQRTYEKTCDEMDQMKTKQGKINKFEKYLKSLEAYHGELTAKNLKQLAKIKQDYQRMMHHW